MRRKKKQKPAPKQLDASYHKRRVEDFEYYLDRSDMSNDLIALSLEIPRMWIHNSKKGKLVRPNDHRITIVIDFVKDFERLQSYYCGLLRKQR